MSVLDRGSSEGGQKMSGRGEASNRLTESDLLRRDAIRPEDVLQLKGITSTYLCPTNANVYNIDFVKFKIRDVDSGAVLFEIAKPPDYQDDDLDSEAADSE